MKQTIFLISIFLTLNLFGQKLIQKVGDIEIQLIGHNFKRNSNYELTKKETNKRNRPHLKKYFDSTGKLLKTISFGKHHNTDLRVLNKIEIYEYDSNGTKSQIDIWETDYNKKLSYKYYKKFELDSTKSKIISEITYELESDSIFTQTNYWYNKKGQYQGVIFDSTYYYKREFNQKGKLIKFQQIYDGKLRWEWNYTYSDNQREGIFQTYYNDGKDYSTKEIQTYSNQGLIEIEEIQVSKGGLNERTKIHYNKDGVISKIEYYESYNKEKGFEMISYTNIRIKSKIKIDSQIAERINEEIIE